MTYQIVISPTLKISVDDFITSWNENDQCRSVAEAKRADLKTISYEIIDPELIRQGLIFLGGVAGAVALDVVKDLAKEHLTAILKKLGGKGADQAPEIEVEAVEQPDGAYLLVIKEQE